MRQRFATLPLALASVAFIACASNPTAPDLSESLSAELEFALTDLVTLTETEVEVRVHGSDGDLFTDFSSLSVEVRRDGEIEWESIELALHGDHFSAEMMFFSSGEYEGRVVGQVTGSSAMLTLYETTEHLHVGRIHKEVGDHVVEFETFPGHLHEGATVEVSFWVLEASSDGHGHGHAVGGLAPELHCTDADGTMEEHAAHEHEEGEYGAEHVISGAGMAVFEIHFTDSTGMDRHVEFTAPVSDDH